MTALIRNTAGEDRYIPLAGDVVADGETFEVPDDVFDEHVWERPNFHVVREPKRSPKPRPALEAADVKES